VANMASNGFMRPKIIVEPFIFEVFCPDGRCGRSPFVMEWRLSPNLRRASMLRIRDMVQKRSRLPLMTPKE